MPKPIISNDTVLVNRHHDILELRVQLRSDIQEILVGFLHSEQRERCVLAESQQSMLRALGEHLASIGDKVDSLLPSTASCENLSSTKKLEDRGGHVVDLYTNGGELASIHVATEKIENNIGNDASNDTSQGGAGLTGTTTDESRGGVQSTPDERGADAWDTIERTTSSTSLSDRDFKISFASEQNILRSTLGPVVASSAFNLLVCSVVLIHALWMGYSADSELSVARKKMGNQWVTSRTHKYVDAFFLCFYALEVILKLLAWGRKYFYNREKWWNVFDIVLICSGVLDFVDATDVHVMFLAWIRYAKPIVRALRLLRIMRQFRVLRQIIISMASAFVTFVWAVFAMGVILYMWAIIFMHGVLAYLEEGADNTNQIDTEALLKYWGSLSSAMLTEYKSVTGGEPWGKAANALIPAGLFYHYLFLVYIALLVVAVLRMITGIFVQDAQSASELDRGKTLNHNLKTMFREFDTNGSGNISRKEFRESFQSGKAAHYFKQLDIQASDAEKLFAMMDASGNNQIDLEEFIRGCQKFNGWAKHVDMALMLMYVRNLQKSIDTFMQQSEECLDLVSRDAQRTPAYSAIRARMGQAHQQERETLDALLRQGSLGATLTSGLSAA